MPARNLASVGKCFMCTDDSLRGLALASLIAPLLTRRCEFTRQRGISVILITDMAILIHSEFFACKEITAASCCAL